MMTAVDVTVEEVLAGAVTVVAMMIGGTTLMGPGTKEMTGAAGVVVLGMHVHPSTILD